MTNSELYKKSIDNQIRSPKDFIDGALWLLEQLEKKKLILVPGSNEMFAAGYEAGQDSILKMMRTICGKE